MHVAARFLMPIARNIARDVAGAALGAAINETAPAIARAIGAPPPTPPLSDESRRALALPTDARPTPTAPIDGSQSVMGVQVNGAPAVPKATRKIDPADIKPGSLVLLSSSSLDDLARSVERGDGRAPAADVGIAVGRGKLVEGKGISDLGERSAQVWEPRDSRLRAALIREAAAATRDGTPALEAVTRAVARELGRPADAQALQDALAKSGKFTLVGAT